MGGKLTLIVTVLQDVRSFRKLLVTTLGAMAKSAITPKATNASISKHSPSVSLTLNRFQITLTIAFNNGLDRGRNALHIVIKRQRRRFWPGNDLLW